MTEKSKETIDCFPALARKFDQNRTSGAHFMKQALFVFLRFALIATFLSSCTASNDILKALKIDYSPSQDTKTEPTLSKADLEKELAAAKKREATLKEQVAALEKKIDASDAARDLQMTELREDLYKRETALTEEIGELRKELEEKEALISIQSKVIGLLDDADQTLQKSIEEQVRDR